MSLISHLRNERLAVNLASAHSFVMDHAVAQQPGLKALSDDLFLRIGQKRGRILCGRQRHLESILYHQRPLAGKRLSAVKIQTATSPNDAEVTPVRGEEGSSHTLTEVPLIKEKSRAQAFGQRG